MFVSALASHANDTLCSARPTQLPTANAKMASRGQDGRKIVETRDVALNFFLTVRWTSKGVATRPSLGPEYSARRKSTTAVMRSLLGQRGATDQALSWPRRQAQVSGSNHPKPTAYNSLATNGLVPPVRLRPSCESGRMDSVRCFVPPTRRREGRTMRLDGQHPPPVREGFLHPRTVQRLTNNLPRAPARGVMPTVRNRPAGRPRDQGWLANLRRPDLREWPTQEDSESGSLGRRSPPIVRRLATGSKRPGYLPKASMNFTKPRTSW